MTEEAEFRVTQTRGNVEFRVYPHLVLASVTVNGDFETAPNYGFRPLVQYISGDNVGATKLAMTAPVMHVATSDTSHVISFVLPRETPAVPTPRRKELSTHTMDNLSAAAVRFTGAWKESRARRAESDLRALLAEWKVRVVGDAIFARYDPPWKPGFLRRNEIIIPIDATTIPTP